MAKFLATVLTDAQLKEGLSLGTAGAPAALVGLAESALTQKLKFSALSGVGMINPLLSVFAEPIVSEIKRQLNATVLDPILGKPEHIALNAIAKDTSSDPSILAKIGNEILTRIPGSNIVLPNQKVSPPASLPKAYGLKPKFDRPTGSQQANVGSKSVRRFLSDEDTTQRQQEFAMSHRFYLSDITQDNTSVFDWEEGTDPRSLTAGFNYCSTLSMAVETESIKEGTWEFVREVPLKVSTEKITLRKGMVTTQSGFYLWLMNALQGNVTRRTLRLVAYGRSGGQRLAAVQRLPDGQALVTQPQNSQGSWGDAKQLYGNRVGVWKLINCIPVGYAVSDWDADAKAIQMTELTIACELVEEQPITDVR